MSLARASVEAAGGTGRLRRLQARLDPLVDRLATGELHRTLDSVQRKLSLTSSGYIALGGAVIAWLLGRVVAGTIMYIAAYGAVAFVVLALATAPRRLGLRGERAGLFPRTREGDRLEVEVRLRARRGVSTFVLEERIPEKLGTPVRVPITRLGANKEVSHRYSLRCARRGAYQVGPLVAVAADPLGLSRRETIV